MQDLKQQLRAQRDTMSSAHATRLHRALSWMACAQQHDDDDDVVFIALWIGFNACYGVDGEPVSLTERDSFTRFVTQLVALDADQQIYHCLWMNFSGFVRTLIDNPYVFAPFWTSRRDGDDKWQQPFQRAKKLAMEALAANDVARLLAIVLDRLYVLRNQLMHGGATWRSQVNRQQVRDGRRLLQELLPLLVAIMLNAPDRDWGDIYFPVV